MADARQQAHDPSIQAILFQSRALRDRLASFCESEYPPEALRIRDLFAVLTDQIEARLRAIHERRIHDSGAQGGRPLGEADTQHVLQLGTMLQELHARLRFLESSKPPTTPPEIQTAITALVRLYVAPALNCDAGKVLVLVRPQWTYNLKYVPLLEELAQFIEPAVLDPNGDISTEGFRPYLAALWQKHRGDAAPLPDHIAIVSFAGLDSYDALLYPLLAHEIGHLIDYGYPDTIHNHPDLRPQEYVITTTDAQEAFDRHYPPDPPSIALDPYRSDEVSRLRNERTHHIHVCLREITTDLLAVRMLGFAYFMAMAEYLKARFPWPEDPVNDDTGYPGMAYRLRIVFDELTAVEAEINALGHLQQLLETAPEGPARAAFQHALDYLGEWRRRFESYTPQPVSALTPRMDLTRLVQRRVEAILPDLRRLIRRVIPRERVPAITPRLGDLVLLLAERAPPAQPLLRPEDLIVGLPDSSFSDVLMAGWLYELTLGEDREDQTQSTAKAHEEYQKTCRLLFKAIELHGAREAIRELEEQGGQRTEPPQRSRPEPTGQPGAVSGPLLVEVLSRPDLQRRLFLTPYYGLAPVNTATLDIRLGNWFRFARRTRTTYIDPTDPADQERMRREGQHEVYVPFGQFFTLHPEDFVLAVSLEYLALPPDLVAFVEGKSGLGRAGLIVATATQVAPGFKGGIVLELFNSGTVPIRLRPGMPIAQLAFFVTDRPVPLDWVYAGKFQCQVKP